MLSAIKYWVWLSTALDPLGAWLVYAHFGSPEEAYFADDSSYDFIEGLTIPLRTALKEKDISRAEEILDDCTRSDIRIITWQDASYPLDHYRHLFPLKATRIPSYDPRKSDSSPATHHNVQHRESLEKRVDTANSPVYIDVEALRDQFTDDELAVLTALQHGPLSTDDLIERAALPAPRAVAAINLLVLRGFAVELPGKRFQLSHHPEKRI